MENVKIADLPVQPLFELEDFMNFAHETRISAAALENFSSLWEDWAQKLRAANLQGGKDSWLAVWLPEEIEKTIDKSWQESPGEGFLLNNLAQYMCMTAVGDLLPQTIDLGCAPTPARCESLSRGLAKIGLAGKENSLNRRYAVLSWYPFRGGCEICALRDNCPKTGASEFAGFTLPGHERGEA